MKRKAVNDMKCNNCQHENVCKNVKSMEKFDSEIRQMTKLLENKTFHADIRCDDFLSKSNAFVK
jgi:hypothetical protein